MLTKYIHYLRSKVNGKTVGLVFIVYLVFPLLIFPLSEKLQHHYSGRSVRPLDLEFGFSPKSAFNRVKEYGERGRKLYAISALTVDIAYPVVYSTFLAMLIIFFQKKSHTENKYPFQPAYLPFVAASFDFLENIGIVILLLSYPSKWRRAALFTSAANMIKWSSVALTILFIAIIAFIWLFKSGRKTYI